MAKSEPKRPASKRKPRASRMSWERGYYSHGYWQGKNKLGSVRLGPRDQWDGIYRWQAGGHAGQTTSLAEAKRAVEQAVLVGSSQLLLFGEPDDTPTTA